MWADPLTNGVLVNEVAEAMTERLTKLEVYLFHNNLYGYALKPDPKNLLASSYAKPDSLIDVKKIVKHRKKKSLSMATQKCLILNLKATVGRRVATTSELGSLVWVVMNV